MQFHTYDAIKDALASYCPETLSELPGLYVAGTFVADAALHKKVIRTRVSFYSTNQETTNKLLDFLEHHCPNQDFSVYDVHRVSIGDVDVYSFPDRSIDDVIVEELHNPYEQCFYDWTTVFITDACKSCWQTGVMTNDELVMTQQTYDALTVRGMFISNKIAKMYGAEVEENEDYFLGSISFPPADEERPVAKTHRAQIVKKILEYT